MKTLQQYVNIRMHNKELFQRNHICLPQKLLLHKSSDTVPNPAVDKDIGLLLVAGLSCRSSLMAAVPWAVSRAAAPRSSCTPGLGLQTPHPRAPWVFSPGLISIKHHSQTRKKPCRLNSQSSQISLQCQYPGTSDISLNMWTS